MSEVNGFEQQPWERIVSKDFGCGITKKVYPAPSATPPPVAMTNLFIVLIIR